MVGIIVRVRVLGAFGVEFDGRGLPGEVWRRRQRAADLVKILALADGHRLTREEAMAGLWPELDAHKAGANLRKATFHARQLVGRDDVVVLDRKFVTLFPTGKVSTDVEAFEEAARAVLAHTDGGARAEAARHAAGRYAGELLPDDRGRSWRDARADDVERLYRELLLASGQWGRLLALDPTTEVAHRGIMRERLEAGDRAGAIRQFDQLRQVLREELGVSPDPDSVALYEQILANEGREVPTPAERARALLAWGMVHWERADLEEAGRVADEAHALAVDAGLGRELADASELRGLVAYAQGRWQEVFAADFLEALETRAELAPFVYDANLCMSEFALHEPRGLEHIGRFAGSLLEASERSGSLHARAVGLLLHGEVGLLSGHDPSSVAQALEASRAVHRASSAETGTALAAARQAQLEARCGRATLATQLHEEALELAAASPVPNHLLPLIYGGMLEAARSHVGGAVLERAETALSDVDTCDPCSMSFHLAATAVSRDAGALDDARARLAEAERISRMWQDGPWHAAVEEAEAALRQVEGGSRVEAAARFSSAAAKFEECGRHPDAARCRAAINRFGPARSRA